MVLLREEIKNDDEVTISSKLRGLMNGGFRMRERESKTANII